MTVPLDANAALDALRPEPGLVVLMCGVAGSGKTTFAKGLEARGFLRLSIDEEVWRGAGRFGLDFDAAAYPQHLENARAVLRRRLIDAMRGKIPSVVDSAFWGRAARDDYKRLIEAHGCVWTLVYLKAEPSLLRARLLDRSRRFDANAAFAVDDAMLERFLGSFEAPAGEGELTVAVA